MPLRFLASALVLISANVAPAQTALAWKLKKGDLLEAERSAVHRQAVTVNGKPAFSQERHSIWQVRLEVKEANAEGFRIAATLTKVEHQNADAGLAEKLQGSTFTILVTPSGKITELRGYEQWLGKVAGNEKQRIKELRESCAENTLKEAFSGLFGPLPEKPVDVGDLWERDSIEEMPHFGRLCIKERCRFERAEMGRAFISMTMQTRYELPKDVGAVLFRIAKGSIDGEKAEGRLVFDQQRGMLLEQNRSIRLTGKLTVETKDRQAEMGFSSFSEIKIRINTR